MADMADHRRHARLPVSLHVRYRNGDELASSYIDSLSRGGVFVRTSRPLPVGTELMMEITLEEGDRPIRLRGRVVWDRLVGREDGMGVEFLDPLPPDVPLEVTAGKRA